MAAIAAWQQLRSGFIGPIVGFIATVGKAVPNSSENAQRTIGVDNQPYRMLTLLACRLAAATCLIVRAVCLTTLGRWDDAEIAFDQASRRGIIYATGGSPVLGNSTFGDIFTLINHGVLEENEESSQL